MVEMAEASDLDCEDTGFKPPAPKSLDEIRNSDKDDHALENYKKALLGQQIPDPIFPDNPKSVIVEKIQIVFPNENRPPAELLLKDQNLEILKKSPIVVKEGVSYQVKIFFFVQREIVSGLRYVQATYKMGVRVSKDDLMVGSYAPKDAAHEFSSPISEAPAGMIARGSYTVKSRFTDDDKQDFLTWEWAMKISSSWKD